MSFKVVATRERGRILFTGVPSSWENKNILKWPEDIPHSVRESLRSNCGSTPEDSWRSYDCIVKFSGISTFNEALNLENVLAKCSDSDAEELAFVTYLQKKQKTDKHIIPDRNLILEKEIIIKEIPPNEELVENLVSCRPNINLSGTVVNTNENVESIYDENQDSNTNNIVLVQSNQLQTLIDLSNNIISEIQRIETYQKTEIAKINVRLDNIYSIIRNNQSKNQNENVPGGSNELFEQKFPLSTCDEINSFNEKIKTDLGFKEKIIKELSKIGGTTGMEVGNHISYKIVDYIFTKEILTSYTWTGISRDKSLKKSFSGFHGIIDVLFQVIQKADNHWSLNKTELILKDNILKQAKKRHSRHQEKTAKKIKLLNNNREGDTEESENIDPNIMVENEGDAEEPENIDPNIMEENETQPNDEI